MVRRWGQQPGPSAVLRCGKLIAAVYGLLVAAAAPQGVAAQEVTEEERVTIRKTMQQLHFQLPPDWPIEKRGGIVAPIPIEEYLARKFKALESKLQALEQRLNGLDLRLRVLEESQKAKAAGLRSSEQPAIGGAR